MDIEMRIPDEEVEVGRILKYAFAWGIVVGFDGSLYIFEQRRFFSQGRVCKLGRD